MTSRWSILPELQQSADFVRAIPRQLGSWNYVEDGKPMTEGVIAELGVTEYVSRVYANGTDSVTLMLISGRTGRLIRHTPDICYESVGNTFLGEPTPVTLDVDGQEHQFRVLPIRPSSELTGDFAVVYGFAHGGRFLSPATPRLAYHGLPAVEKIQILCRSEPEKLGEIPKYAESFVQEICRYIQQKPSGK